MDWISKLKEYAPHIAGAVLSGGATLPSLAMKAIKDATGADVETETQLEALVSGSSPEEMIRLKQADNAFKIRMRELDQELDASELKDTQHAREQHKDSNMPSIICITLTLGLFAFVAALMIYEVPDNNRRMIDMIFGSYLTAWISSVAYFVGTTRGSSIKNAALMGRSARG